MYGTPRDRRSGRKVAGRAPLAVAGGNFDITKTTPLKSGDLFSIGSTTKMFTATLMFQLIEEGKVSLDDPIIDHLPAQWASVLREMKHGDEVTIRQALTHRSGLYDYIINTTFFNGLLENIPALLLLMMPVLAMLQKLFYLGSGKYYVEHLVLTIHNHSFLLMVFILVFLLDLLVWTDFGILPPIAGFLRSLLNLWVVAYLFLSLRLFFGQGYFVTAVKFFTISVSYGAFLVIGVLLFMLIGFFIY